MRRLAPTTESVINQRGLMATSLAALAVANVLPTSPLVLANLPRSACLAGLRGTTAPFLTTNATSLSTVLVTPPLSLDSSKLAVTAPAPTLGTQKIAANVHSSTTRVATADTAPPVTLARIPPAPGPATSTTTVLLTPCLSLATKQMVATVIAETRGTAKCANCALRTTT
jgi:hypothetical protein